MLSKTDIHLIPICPGCEHFLSTQSIFYIVSAMIAGDCVPTMNGTVKVFPWIELISQPVAFISDTTGKLIFLNLIFDNYCDRKYEYMKEVLTVVCFILIVFAIFGNLRLQFMKKSTRFENSVLFIKYLGIVNLVSLLLNVVPFLTQLNNINGLWFIGEKSCKYYCNFHSRINFSGFRLIQLRMNLFY